MITENMWKQFESPTLKPTYDGRNLKSLYLHED